MSKDSHAIATKPLEVRPYDILRYQVRSETNPKVWHVVDVLDGRCSCDHFMFRLDGSNRLCKHLKVALRFFALEMIERIKRYQVKGQKYPNHD